MPLRKLMAEIPDPVFLIDRGTLEILFLNPPAAALGYSSEEPHRLRLTDILAPGTGHTLLAVLQQPMTPRLQIPAGTAGLLRKDSASPFTCRFVCTALQDTDRDLVMVLAVSAQPACP